MYIIGSEDRSKNYADQQSISANWCPKLISGDSYTSCVGTLWADERLVKLESVDTDNRELIRCTTSRLQAQLSKAVRLLRS